MIYNPDSKTAKTRAEVIRYYGGACACCGETELKFLCLDHVNKDGADFRKQHRVWIYSWARKNHYPATLQVLCHNCNCAKGFYGICPHEIERQAPYLASLEDFRFRPSRRLRQKLEILGF